MQQSFSSGDYIEFTMPLEGGSTSLLLYASHRINETTMSDQETIYMVVGEMEVVHFEQKNYEIIYRMISSNGIRFIYHFNTTEDNRIYQEENRYNKMPLLKQL